MRNADRSIDPYWQGSRNIPASAIAVVAVTLLMAAIAAIWPARPEAGAFVPERHASLVFPYRGQEWVAAPVARTLTVPDEVMTAVETRNNVTIYAPIAHPGGGGGSTIPQPLYVRMDDGMYLPLMPRGTVGR